MDALDVALRLAAALERAGVGYFIGASFASSMQGEPRATNDIDVVVDLGEERVAALDAEYLDTWAGRLGLEALLAKARAEAR